MLAKSQGRQAKERAIRRKRLARLLRKLRAMRKSLAQRDQLLLRIGAAQKEAGRAFAFVKLRLPKKDEQVHTRDVLLPGKQSQAEASATTGWALPRMAKILEQPENQKSAMMNGSHERQSVGSSTGVCNGAGEPGTAPPERVVVRHYCARS